MNYLILAACWAIYSSSIFRSLRRRELSLWFGANLGIMYLMLLPLTVVAWTGGVPAIPRTKIPEVHWLRSSHEITIILAMLATYWILSTLARTVDVEPRDSQQQVTPFTSGIVRLPHIAAGYLVLGVTLFVASGLLGGGTHWARTKHEFMVQYGIAAYILIAATTSVKILLLVTSTVHWIRKHISTATAISYIAAACVFDIYSTGNRIYTLYSLFLITVVLLYTRHFRVLSVVAIGAIPFGYVMVIFESIRAHMYLWREFSIASAIRAFQSGWTSASRVYAGRLGTDQSGIAQFVLGITEGGSLNVLVGVIKHYTSTNDYLNGMTILKPFFLFIPRSIWASKPETFSATIGKIMIPGTTVSLSSTCFGEYFGNFGLWGIILIAPVFLVLQYTLSKVFSDRLVSNIFAFLLGFYIIRMSLSDSLLVFGGTMAMWRVGERIQPSPQTAAR